MNSKKTNDLSRSFSNSCKRGVTLDPTALAKLSLWPESPRETPAKPVVALNIITKENKDMSLLGNFAQLVKPTPFTKNAVKIINTEIELIGSSPVPLTNLSEPNSPGVDSPIFDHDTDQSRCQTPDALANRGILKSSLESRFSRTGKLTRSLSRDSTKSPKVKIVEAKSKSKFSEKAKKKK